MDTHWPWLRGWWFQTNARAVEASCDTPRKPTVDSFRRTLVRLKQDLNGDQRRAIILFQTNARAVEARKPSPSKRPTRSFRRTLVRLKRRLGVQRDLDGWFQTNARAVEATWSDGRTNPSKFQTNARAVEATGTKNGPLGPPTVSDERSCG